MFWKTFAYGMATGLSVRVAEYVVGNFFLKKTPISLGSLVKESEDVGARVELSLIFDQFVGRIHQCDKNITIIDEREALFMLAEQLSNLEDKCSGDIKKTIGGLLSLIEQTLTRKMDARSVSRQIRDAILQGTLRV